MRPILHSITTETNRLAPAVNLVKQIRPPVLKNELFAVQQIDHLILLLKTDAELRKIWSGYIIELLRSKECLDAFCESGILPGTTFLNELYRRAIHKLIPELYEEKDLRTAIVTIFNKKSDPRWLKEVSIEKWSELLNQIDYGPGEGNLLAEQIANALVVLSHRITSLGLEPELSSKLPDIDKLASPFITQSEEIIRFVQKISVISFQPEIDENDVDYKHIQVLLHQCEEILKNLRAHKNEFGASIPLTYIMVRLQQHINRVKLLLKLFMSNATARHEATVMLMYEIIQSEHQKNSFIGYLNQNIDLIAYQVAEHGSKTGQHYITQTKTEYAYLFKSSMKGGMIVGIMALVKLLISYIKMAPAWYAFSYSMNYALGFISMHVSHSALATKQPALTAQSMAAAIHTDLYNHKKLDGIGEMVARVSRSQLVSFAGNLLTVFPMGMLLAFLYQLITGHHLANEQKARHLVHDLHPFTSGSLIFASIAGTYLFLTGIISGYVDNIVIYRNIPDRIRRHWLLLKIFPMTATTKIGRYMEKNIGAIVGNLFFGFCMGSTSILGHFFGIGADIRHITFAAANFGMAVISLNFNLGWYDVLWTLAGIAGIGFFNFMVSFNLAFYVALKARGVVIKDTFKIMRSMWGYFKQHPLAFIWPPKPVAATEVG
jgi:site-specific recombinase